MRVRIFVLTLLLGVTSLFAQKATFELNGKVQDTLVLDFGRVKESLMKLEAQLIIKNSGTSVGKLLSIAPSCDCIIMENWENKEFTPKQSDTLALAIQIDNRPGKLEKTLLLKTNGTPAKMLVIMKGYVVPVFESVEEQYPYKSGQLWFELRNQFISVGNIKDTDTINERVYFYNASLDSLVINYTQKATDPVKLAFQKRVLKAKEIAYFDLTYFPQKVAQYGHVKLPLVFTTNEKLYPRKELYFHAYVMPELDFSSDSIPALELDTNLLDFGTVSDSASVDRQIAIKNVGTAILEIKQLKANCPCLKLSVKKDYLKPGEEVMLNVVLDPRRRIGDLDKRISVFSNAPDQPVVVIDVKATIKD